METSSVASQFAMYRFGLSAILAFGGIVCIFCGYRLFMNGAGLAKAIEKFDFKNNNHRISAAGLSVGAVLLLTSGFWGYFSYSSFPRLEIAGDFIKITGVPIERVIGTPVVTANKENVGTIADVLMNSKAKTTGIVVKIDKSPTGKKVVVDPKDFDFALSKGSAVIKLTGDALRNSPNFDWNAIPGASKEF